MTHPSASRMLAVAFGPPTMREALAGLPRIRAQADCVELRLDLFDEPLDLPMLLRERADLPAVITLRSADQGGRSRLSAAERLQVLQAAADLGAEFIDVEFDAATPERLARLRAAGARVIVSRHDFHGMPPDFGGWWAALADSGADAVKVVGTAHTPLDSLPVFRAFRGADRPTVAIAMGAPGLLTRVLALREPACLLTYAALDALSGTAPGQVTLDEMRAMYRTHRLSPATRAFGLLGPHVEGARLAEYNDWFADEGVDAVTVPLVADLTADAAATVNGFRELPIDGWHIHGEQLQVGVVAALDDLAPTAARQHKVNAVVRRVDGGLVGHWVASPREQYAVWRAG